jgi:ABC-type uncharacterized transport system substrate-binding protein
LSVKAHVGIHGNETADRLAKEVAQSKSTIAFNRIPKSTLYYEAEDEAKQKWQKEWEKCPKAAITKHYFPTVQDRLNTKLRITPIIVVMVTEHAKTWAYLHRFKLLQSATCACNVGDQTVDHLLYQCTLLQTQREILKKGCSKNRKLACKQKGTNNKILGPILNLYKLKRF